MSLPRALGLIAMLSLVAAPSSEAQLPVGEADGVRVVRQPGAIVVKFTPKADTLWRRVAGRRVLLFCADLPADSSDRDPSYSREAGFRAPKRGRTLRLRTGDRTRGIDYCLVLLDRRRSRPLIAAIPLTQLGAVYLDESEKAGSLLAIVLATRLFAEEKGLKAFPTHSQLVEFIAALPAAPSAELVAGGIVALASPAEAPPDGKLGYYSDGAERMAVVIVSGSGRRLFIELEPDEVQRTNVAFFIYGRGILPF
jgi:hypothetical protein